MPVPLRTRFRAALSRLLLGPVAGRAAIHAIPIPSFGPLRGSRAILDMYEEDGWLQALVDTVAGPVAGARFRVFVPVRGAGGVKRYRMKAYGADVQRKMLKSAVAAAQWVDLDDHSVLRMLYAPHPKFSGRSYLHLLAAYILLSGEAFLWLRRSEDGRPVGFELIPPPCVTATPTEGHPCYFVSYNLFAGQVPEADIVWLKRLSPRNPEGRGVGRGKALADEVDTRDAISRSTRSTFQRGGIAAAVAAVDTKSEDLDVEEAVKELEKKYQAEHAGPDQAGKVWFVPGNVSLAQVAVNFRELQMEELDKALRDYLRECFNVPAGAMGGFSGGRAEAEEAKYTLADRAVGPLLEFIVAELNHHLVERVDPEALLTADDPRPESWERTKQLMTAAPNQGWKWNELRSFAGWEPDPALGDSRPQPLPGAQPVQDTPPVEARNPPPPRGPAAE